MTEEKKFGRFNTCTVAGLTQALEMSLEIDKPILVLGGFGVGKSDVIRQVGAQKGYAVLDGIRVAQLLPEDAGGLVSPGEATFAGETVRVVDRLMPDIVSKVWQLRQSEEKPVLLFMDEFSSGTPSIMAALYGVVLERCAAGYLLPPDTRIVAAGNTLEDRGVAYDMPRPMCNRFSIVRFLGPSWPEWEAYGLKVGIHPTVMTFLKNQPDYLRDKVNVDDEDGRCSTPRSWASVSKLLHSADKRGVQHGDRMFLVSSFVGDHAALQMEAYLRLAEKLPTFEEIMADPKTARLDPKDLAASYMATTLLVNRIARLDQFDKGYVYVSRMREEMTAVYIRATFAQESKARFITKNRELLIKHSDVLGAGADLRRSA